MGMAAGAAMQLAGGAVSAAGAYEAGRANGAIHRFNADYERTRAEQTLQTGEYQAGVADLRETQLAGKQASGFAGQGVVAGAGSAGAIVNASEAMSDQDKAMIRLNSRRQAYGLDVMATSEDFQADASIRAGAFNVASSLLGAGGNAAVSAGASYGGGAGYTPGGGGFTSGGGDGAGY